MRKVRWATSSKAGRARGVGLVVMVAGATLVVAGCNGRSEAVAPTTVAPTTVAPTTVGSPSVTTVPVTTRAPAPPVVTDPALPPGVYVGRFSAVDLAHKGAKLTIEDSDPECSGPKSGTYVVDLTNMDFVGTSGTGTGQAVDLTLADWANDWAARDNWTVVNLPGHEMVTNGPNAGCHP